MKISKLKSKLKELGISQRSLSMFIDVTERTVVRWVSENECPTAVAMLLDYWDKYGLPKNLIDMEQDQIDMKVRNYRKRLNDKLKYDKT